MGYAPSGPSTLPRLSIIKLNLGRASAQLRATLITLFLTRFTLSETELSALTSRDIVVGQPVFDALDRVEAIRRDCRALLGGEQEKMQAGYVDFSRSPFIEEDPLGVFDVEPMMEMPADFV